MLKDFSLQAFSAGVLSAFVGFASSFFIILQGLDAEGWRMIDTKGRPGGRGAQIGFVHPSNFGGGLLTHFVQHPET